ncbi:MAG: hypothetical protein L6Q71_04095 [Planctomycetes bacterium]|nr:hypothetical protein [Planctomycetota bacterium]NUQ33813.1 hypothetical protein [Planctomycetaceae bacterium]
MNIAFRFMWITGLIVALSGLATGQAIDPTGKFEEEQQIYEAMVKRPPLFLRTRAFERFARTKDARALDALIKRYEKPGEFPDHEQYLIAGICADNFNGADFVDTMNKWSSKYKDAPHAWLWYNTLRVNTKHRDPALALEILSTKKHDIFFRAAALEALGSLGDVDAISQGITAALSPANAPRDKDDRSLLVESAASALRGAKNSRGDSKFLAAGELVIAAATEEKTLLPRTTLAVGRIFADLFDSEKIFTNASAWRAMLQGAAPKEESEEGRKGTSARFIGVEGSGTHIVFVCDASDSMLIPLTKEEKEELKKKGPTTGKGRDEDSNQSPVSHAWADAFFANANKKDDKKEGEGGNDPDDDIAKLPWDKINNRFEALREFLKLALKGLDKDMDFAVVLFGDKAETLKTTPKLIPATTKNIDAAVDEVMKMKPGPKAPNRPHGTLMGTTNVHGALMLAFQLTRNKTIPACEHVDKTGYNDGADTIFLLSDGEPTSDNYPQLDKREPDIQVGDPEAKTAGPNQEQVIYNGPYVWQPWTYLLRDIHRMNMFRKLEINCIGIGEANINLLNRIARLGLGSVRNISGDATAPGANNPGGKGGGKKGGKGGKK